MGRSIDRPGDSTRLTTTHTQTGLGGMDDNTRLTAHTHTDRTRRDGWVDLDDQA